MDNAADTSRNECSCEDVRGMWNAYWVGELPEHGQHLVEAHILRCKPCREHWKLMRLLEDTPESLWEVAAAAEDTAEERISERPQNATTNGFRSALASLMARIFLAKSPQTNEAQRQTTDKVKR